MPSDEMVEKVARVICSHRKKFQTGPEGCAPICIGARRNCPHAAEVHRKLAEGAIAASDAAHAALAAAEAGEPVADETTSFSVDDGKGNYVYLETGPGACVHLYRNNCGDKWERVCRPGDPELQEQIEKAFAFVASPPSEASRDERETASPGPWPTEAEYELWQNDEFVAGASGSPEDAAREIMHYAAVYGQDGPVKIYEVKRYEVSPGALANAIRARGETCR